MDLNEFGTKLIGLLERIAVATEKAAGGAAAPAKETKSTPTKSTPTKETKKKPTKSYDEMSAALLALKEAHGGPEAKAIISDVGGVEKMADIPEDKFDAVFKAAEERLAELNDEGGEETGDGL